MYPVLPARPTRFLLALAWRACLGLWCLFCHVAHAAGPVLVFDDTTPSIAVRSVAGYHDEREARLTAETAFAAPQLFHLEAGRERRPGAAMRWVRLTLRNAADAPRDRVLALGVPDAEEIEAFVRRDGHVERLLALAADAPYSARPLRERMLGVPLHFAGGETLDLLLRYRTHADTPLSLLLQTPDAFQRALAQGNLANGAVLGLLAALSLFALLQYVAAEERAFLAYAAMAAMMMAFLMQFEGYNFAFFWPQAGAWNQRAPVLLVTGIQVAQSLFAMSLFDMRRQYPRLHRAYLGYIALLPVGLALYFGTGLSWLALLLALAYLPLVTVAGVFFLRQRVPVAGLFLAGALCNAIFTNLLFGLSVAGLGFERHPFLYPKIGYVCEALFFALALTRQLQRLRRQVEDGLRRHLLEAEQLARVESEKHRALLAAQQRQLQLASAGHDLSQPLASIRFALAALRAQGGNETTAGHIDRALDYTESLLHTLIDDARRSHVMQPTTLDLDALLAEIRDRHAGAATAKGLTLHHRPTTRRVAASALLLTRILDNLVGNAIRYTPRGRILLGVRYRVEGLEIQVRDSGPGIEPGQQARLLAPFSRGSATTTQGYGLGLHIVHTLCAQAGYRLAINSAPGMGSTFGVVIPHGA